jgi:hypothetical protein
VCCSDHSKQSKTVDGSVASLGHVKWSVLTYLQNGGRREGSEERSLGRVNFKNS